MTESLSKRQRWLLSTKDNRPFMHSQLIELTACFANLFHVKDGRVGFPWDPDGLRKVVDRLLIVAARYSVNMEAAVWEKYPWKCSYCTECPCVCGPEKPRKAKQLGIPSPTGEVLGLEYLQNMLAGIYPKGRHRLHETVAHVMEEIGEASDAIVARDRPQAKEEFADIFARIVQVANTLDITLAETD